MHDRVRSDTFKKQKNDTMSAYAAYWFSRVKASCFRRNTVNGTKMAATKAFSSSFTSQSSSRSDQSKWLSISTIAATTTILAASAVEFRNNHTKMVNSMGTAATSKSAKSDSAYPITSCDDSGAFRSFRDYRFHGGEEEEEQVQVKVIYSPKTQKEGEEVSFSCSHRDHLKSVNALKNAMELIMQEQYLRHQQELTGDGKIMATSTPSTTEKDVIDTQPRRIQLDRNCVHTKKMYFYAAPKVTPQLAARTLLISGPSSITLSTDVAQLLGLDLNATSVGSFSDGETAISFEESVRAKNCFIITSTRTADHVMQLLLLISALRRASAKTITAVIPYYGYSRQDRRLSREPIAAADLAKAFEAMGVDNVFCLDLHSDSLVGFFEPKTTVEHLLPIPVAAAYFNEEFVAMADALRVTNPEGKWEYPKVTIVASHEGHMERAVDFQYALQRLSGHEVQVALISKGRNARGGKKYEPSLVGDVKGRVCVIIDDIVNTGDTIIQAINQLKVSGADSVYAWATHPVFGDGSAPQKLQDCEALEYILISNTVAWDGAELPLKIRQLSLAPLLAEAISRQLLRQTISGFVGFEEPPMPSRYDDAVTI